MASIIKRKYRAPDGTIRECDHYTVQYRNAAGKIERVKGYKDRAATKQLCAKIELALARGEQFMIDPHKAEKARPLAEHIREYVADLKAAGRDDKYVEVMERRLKIVANGCGWQKLTDIEPNSFIRWREQVKKTHVRRGRLGEGASAETLNQYLESACGFTHWCAETRRLPGVPMIKRGKYGRSMMATVLAGVAKVTGEKRRKRRALTDEQVTALLGVAGDRALVYRTALAIGLRRAEMEALVWGDVRLNAIRPYVQLRAEATKARRGDRLDLPATLADALRQYRPTAAKDGQRVFPAVPDIDQWRADLEAAGIPYKDDMGRQADFHSNRKTMCSRMQRAGVPLAVAMRRMRHTDARLTMIDYTDESQIGLEAGALPELEPSKKESNGCVTQQASSSA